jgi:hypothetical protein
MMVMQEIAGMGFQQNTMKEIMAGDEQSTEV